MYGGEWVPTERLAYISQEKGAPHAVQGHGESTRADQEAKRSKTKA